MTAIRHFLTMLIGVGFLLPSAPSFAAEKINLPVGCAVAISIATDDVSNLPDFKASKNIISEKFQTVVCIAENDGYRIHYNPPPTYAGGDMVYELDKDFHILKKIFGR